MEVKLISFHGKPTHIWFVVCFYFSRIDMVPEAKEGFFFRHTSNHSADSNEGCLKTDDVFTCFLVQISDSASS